jgi:predicted permease
VCAEVDEELRFHLDMRVEELTARGMPVEEARREATWHFGDLAYTRQYCVEQGARKEGRVRRTVMLDELRQDVAIGCRRLWKTRGVAGVALLTLAIGIGANTAVFSLVNAALLRPLPYADPDRLVVYYEGLPKAGIPKISFSPADYLDFARDQRTSSAFGIFQNNESELGGDGTPERIMVTRVSPSVFDILGVQAAVGRTFQAGDDRPGADICVLSYALWQRRFGARGDMLGRPVTIDRRPHVVVGIMPPRFYFPLAGLHANNRRADIWVPFAFAPIERQARGMLYRNGVIARLKAGVTLDEARAEVPVLVKRAWAAYPVEFHNMGFQIEAQVQSLRGEITGDIRQALVVLLAAVGLVLLVACANVANLLLSRAAAREHEVVVMSALGASGGRLRQMLLTESGILGLAAGAVGLFLAWIVTDAAPAALPERLASLGDITPDWRVAAFTLTVSVVTALAFGLVPASATARPDLQSALRTMGRSTTSGRHRRLIQHTLVVVTVTLSVVLLVGAGLLARSFAALVSTDVGVRTDHVLTATVSLPASAYREGARIRGFYQQAVERLQALPGVSIAAASTDLPLAGREHLAFTPDGSPVERTRLPQGVAVTWPLGDYFRAHGILLKRGRLFTDVDREGSEPVVIVNESFARRVWPGDDVIGKRIKWGLPESPTPWSRIVGIVADVKTDALDADAEIHVYEPFAQLPAETLAETGDFFRTMSVTLRTATDPRTFGEPLRREIASLDPALALSEVMTMEERVAAASGPERLSAMLMLGFAGAALLMAAIGIYGILAYTVAQRTREIGVRVALGAQQQDVLTLVARQGLTLTFIGLAAGIVSSLALTRFMIGLLYRTAPQDPWTLGAAGAVLISIAALACYLPARRAARIDPVQALRTE